MKKSKALIAGVASSALLLTTFGAAGVSAATLDSGEFTVEAVDREDSTIRASSGMATQVRVKPPEPEDPGEGGTTPTIPETSGIFRFTVDSEAPGCVLGKNPMSLIGAKGTVKSPDGSETTLNYQTIATPESGTYEVKGSFSRVVTYPGNACLVSIDLWEDGTGTTSASFLDTVNLRSVAQPPSTLTNMRQMFQNAKSLDSSIESWDVSKVTDMSWMFFGSEFNGDLSGWDVSSVRNMNSTFRYSKLNNDSLRDWNVSSVEDMAFMFNMSSFDGDLSGWRPSSATTMESMFARSALSGGDFSQWTTDSLTNLKEIFSSARSFNGDVSNWDVSKVENFDFAFASTDFNGDLSRWDVSKGKSFQGTFQYTKQLENNGLDSWNTSSAENLSSMFRGAEKFNGSLESWKTGTVKNFDSMFLSTKVFNGNIEEWDVSDGTHFGRMFNLAVGFDRDLSGWNVANATNWEYFVSSKGKMTQDKIPAKFRS